jgi:putative copper resistance protein D
MDDPLIYVRAIHFAATLTVAGIAFFMVFVAEPAWRGADFSGPSTFHRRIRWLAWSALLLAVASGAVWLVFLAQIVSDQPLRDVFNRGIVWALLTRTGFGHIWFERLVIACALAVTFIPFLSASARPSWIVKAVVVLLACGFVGLMVWAGHAAGGMDAEAVIHPVADILHLVAASAWAGGLLPLALFLAAARRDQDAFAATQTATLRFSTLGIVCVAVLLASGSINAWYLVGSISALTQTDYGRLVLTKVALFVVMVAIAALNRLRLTPQLAARSHDLQQAALRRLRRNVAIEIAAGATIVAVVAALGVTPPAHLESGMPNAHHHSH